METQETGASNAGADDSETLHAEQADENANGGTSTDGQHEDADDVATLKQRIADKDSHISNLESELAKAKPKKTDAKQSHVTEDDTLWIVTNADALKMAGPEYKKYRERGYAKEDALFLAKRDRGLIKSENTEANRQQQTTTPTPGESRVTKPKRQITEQQRALGITQEMLDKYGPEVEKKKR